jgi:hypothetical protein
MRLPLVLALAALGAGASVSLGFTSSCFVAGFEVQAGGSSPQGGGTPDAATTGGGGGVPGCQHATWPAPPASADPGTEMLDIVAAIRSIDFGEDAVDTGEIVGYDLDNRCSCQGEESACVVPSYATGEHCDGPAGRDNATAYLFDQIGMYSGGLSSQTNTEAIEQGTWTILVRIRDYNGQPNDDQVRLAIYTSPGMDNDPCVPTPVWDGSDRWPVDAVSLVGGEGVGGATGEGGCSSFDAGTTGLDLDAPRYQDLGAYVNDGVVVANLPEAGFDVQTSGTAMNIKFTAGFITARLELDAGTGRWGLRDGLMVGRWKTSDFLSMLGAWQNNGEPICTDTLLYPVIKGFLCQYPDVASTLSGPTTPCDALSFAMAFEAESAQFGFVWRSDPSPTSCPPETDPANDDCG